MNIDRKLALIFFVSSISSCNPFGQRGTTYDLGPNGKAIYSDRPEGLRDEIFIYKETDDMKIELIITKKTNKHQVDKFIDLYVIENEFNLNEL